MQDDWLTRVIGPLPLNAVLVMSTGIYAGVGLALPLLCGAGAPLPVCCNVAGVALGWTALLAWLFPVIQARRREDLLDRTSDLRLLAAAAFEVLVGELLRREGWTVHETGGHGQPDGISTSGSTAPTKQGWSSANGGTHARSALMRSESSPAL